MGSMGFVGVTISDLSDKVYTSTHKSITSFLKFHDTKLIVYIIGDKELELTDDRIEVIHLPKQKYYLQDIATLTEAYFSSMSDILVEKLLCFTRHNNCIFFESDVFFFDTMSDIWPGLADGVHGHPCTYGAIERTNKVEGINTGLVFIKNYQLTYTIYDIYSYITGKTVRWIDEEFLTNWLLAEHQPIHLLSPDINVVNAPIMLKYLNKGIHNTKSVHFCGYPKPYEKSQRNYYARKLEPFVYQNTTLIGYFLTKLYKLLGK